ncbi:site-specific DNA-methyltransferase [Azospirillum sp. sgz302134]
MDGTIQLPYSDLSREQLVQLLLRRDAERKIGLVWERASANENLNRDFVVLDPDWSLSVGGLPTENIIIEGDNWDALRYLRMTMAGRVKCICIDPPYNTKAAFDHYDDRWEHSAWLSAVSARLEVMRELLTPDGSIWVCIDDREGHYLKVLMDEVFGRHAFVANVVWQKRTSRENRAAFSVSHDYVLVYAPMGAQAWRDVRNKLPPTSDGYGNPDGDPRGEWRSIPFTAQGYRANQVYDIVSPTGVVLKPPRGRCWGATEETFRQHLADGRVHFPRGGDSRPRIKRFAFEDEGLVPGTLWTSAEVGDTEEAKREILNLFAGDDIFDTPKPERLIQRILHIATVPGDLVLDAYIGSGTTAAVAHKMGRRYIGIDNQTHLRRFCLPRLASVVAGESGGISPSVHWQGGGGSMHARCATVPFEDVGYDLEPERAWTAIRLIHGLPLGPVEADAPFWLSERDDEAIVYLDRVVEETAVQLQEMAKTKRLTVWSWTPGAVRDALGTCRAVVRKLPDDLVDRFEP